MFPVGCLSEEGHMSEDDDTTIFLWGRWESRAQHDAYLQKRVDMGYFESIDHMMASPPLFMHLTTGEGAFFYN